MQVVYVAISEQMTAGAPPPQFPYTASDLDLDIHPAPRRSTLNSTRSPRASSAASTAPSPAALYATSQPTFSAPDQDEPVDESNLCCPLLGPWKPFWGDMSLRDVGSSEILSVPALMVWRAALAALATATLVLIVVYHRGSLRATQSVAILFSFYCALRLLWDSFMFRRAISRDPNDVTVFERNRRNARFALVYQCTVTLLIFSPFGLWYAQMSKDRKFDVLRSLYGGKLQVIIPVIVLIVAFVIDVWISMIDFRLTYVIPIVVYALIFVFLTMFSYGTADKGRYTWMSVGTLIVVCILTLLYGRLPLVLRRSQLQQRVAEIRPINSLDSVVVDGNTPRYF